MMVTILTESSKKIGLGHLSRCTALHDAFVQTGVHVELRTNEYDAQLTLSDLLIIDSYLLPMHGYVQLARYAKHLAVIDDYQRLKYPAEVLINPALGAENILYDEDYFLLTGAQYALLRREFWKRANKKAQPRSKITNIFITLGGSAPQKVAERIQKACKNAFPHVAVLMATGGFSAQQMIKHMGEADVVISGGGQTLYELACLGIPTIAVKIADNQEFNLKQWQQAGFIEKAIDLKKNDDYSQQVIEELTKMKIAERRKKSVIGSSIVDGQGAHRVASALVEYVHHHE